MGISGIFLGFDRRPDWSLYNSGGFVGGVLLLRHILYVMYAECGSDEMYVLMLVTSYQYVCVCGARKSHYRHIFNRQGIPRSLGRRPRA